MTSNRVPVWMLAMPPLHVPQGGVPCTVEVTADLDADDAETGTYTVTSTGGKATAMDSADGIAKLNKPHPVDTNIVITDVEQTVTDAGLVVGWSTIPADRYTIQPGASSMNSGDVTFTCPAKGVPCIVTVTVQPEEPGITDARTTIMFAGGLATMRNSMAVMTTRAANFLIAATNGALTATQVDTSVTVTRSTGGVTKVALTQDPATPEFTSKAVDEGHQIMKWIGQTLTFGGSEDRMEPEKATVYTNIKSATPQKLMYGGDNEEGAGPGHLRNQVRAGPRPR